MNYEELIPTDLPDWILMNEDGLWCTVCGERLVAPMYVDDDLDYKFFTELENCPSCGWPDDFDPEAV